MRLPIAAGVLLFSLALFAVSPSSIFSGSRSYSYVHANSEHDYSVQEDAGGRDGMFGGGADVPPAAASTQAHFASRGVNSLRHESRKMAEHSMPDATASSSEHQRVIIYTADMRYSVYNLSATVDAITLMMKSTANAYVENAMSNSWSATVKLRVPADSLADFAQLLKKYMKDQDATVDQEQTNSQDVTEEFVDLNARLKALQASRDQLYELLKRATTVQETLNVQREITNLDERIESALGRRKFLESRAAMATITIHLSKKEKHNPVDDIFRWIQVPFDPLVAAKQSLRGILTATLLLVDLTIRLSIMLPPLILIVFVSYKIARKLFC